IRLPADLYTDPLQFQLLVGDESVWQSCVGAQRRVFYPYAFRTIDASGKRVGRWDKPIDIQITDDTIAQGIVYWVITPSAPVRARPAPQQPALSGHTLQISQPAARAGWFFTLP